MSASQDTRARIMEAAEALFSQQGFRAVSMRQIASKASVQLGSITYHFDSKDGLLLSIYRHHCVPMNARRIELMREAERIEDLDQRLEAIVRAFVLPALSSNSDEVGGGARFARLRAKMSSEGHEAVREVIATTFDDTSHALVEAIGHCLPGLAREVIVWRCHFLLGALYYTLINPERVDRLSRGAGRGRDPDEALHQLVAATVGSLKA